MALEAGLGRLSQVMDVLPYCTSVDVFERLAKVSNARRVSGE